MIRIQHCLQYCGERNIKKGERLLYEGNEVKFSLIKKESTNFSISRLCRAMKVRQPAYYEWLKRPAKFITEQEQADGVLV